MTPNPMQVALIDLLAEFRELQHDYDRLKRTYEPPWVAHTSWAMPAAMAALGIGADDGA